MLKAISREQSTGARCHYMDRICYELSSSLCEELLSCDPAELSSLYLTHRSTFNFSNATPAGYWPLSLSSDR